MKYLQVMRPTHWTKNVFVFAAMIFGRQLSGTPIEIFQDIGKALVAFVSFCLASSGVYIINDIVDRDLDKQHPTKAGRPIASESISIKAASIWAMVCLLLALGGAWVCSIRLVGVIAVYILLILGYSLVFKKIMILDVMIIAIGFCLRAVAGAVAVDVMISPWLMICTFALCLFLGFGKRRCELAQLGSSADLFRQTLGGYSSTLLDHMLNVSSGLAVVCFLLYAMDERTYALFNTVNLVYTSPMVLFGIFRFSALIQQGKYRGPVEIMIYDRPFQVSILLWILTCLCIIYKPF